MGGRVVTHCNSHIGNGKCSIVHIISTGLTFKSSKIVMVKNASSKGNVGNSSTCYHDSRAKMFCNLLLVLRPLLINRNMIKSLFTCNTLL